MIWTIFIVCLGLAAARKSVEPEYLEQLLAEGRDEEFAELMQIDVSLVRPDDKRSEGSMMNMVSPLGDIMLLPEPEEEDGRQGLDLDKYRGNRWPGNRIPYVISSSYSQDQQNVILGAINEWNSKVHNIKLVPRGSESDYVMVYSGNGCWSYLGRIGGQQALSLQSNGCVWKGTTLHEFMHAAGFTHEQNRMDRDDFIRILWENIPDRWKSQYQKVSDDDYNLQGPYDYYSIMHYGIIAPDSGGKRAFYVLRSGVDENRIGRGDTLTQIDVDKLNVLYR